MTNSTLKQTKIFLLVLLTSLYNQNVLMALSLTQFHFCMYPYCWVALLAISPRCLARALPVICRIVCLVLCCFLVLVLAYFLFFFLFREFNVREFNVLRLYKKKKKKKKKIKNHPESSKILYK